MTKNLNDFNPGELFSGAYLEYPRNLIPSQFKRYPVYFDELCTYPKSNPILIAVDGPSLRYVRRLNGVCLFCDQPPDHYALAFCFQREVWVLYSYSQYFTAAMYLAQAIQWNGASKIFAMQVQIPLSRGGNYGRF